MDHLYIGRFPMSSLLSPFISICISLLVISAAISGCNPIIKTIYGIHNPRILTDKEVLDFCEKNKFTGVEIRRIKSYNDKTKRNYSYLGNTIPDLLIFNSKSKLTTPQLSCPGDFQNILEMTDEDIDSLPTSNILISDFYDITYEINPNESKLIEGTESCPLFIIKFAEYAGGINRMHIKKWLQMTHLREDISILLLNVDYNSK